MGRRCQGLDFDNVVISPGPAGPRAPERLRHLQGRDQRAPRCRCSACASAIRGSRIARGGRSCHAPEVMHGRMSAVLHDESPLFAGIPQGFEVVRYHSLCVGEPLPACFEVARGPPTACDGRRAPSSGRCGACSSTRSRSAPSTGVGCFANFRDLTAQVAAGAARARAPMRGDGRRAARGRRPKARSPGAWDSSPQARAPATTRSSVFAPALRRGADAFWLDSSKASDARSRFSFMGASGRPAELRS